MKSIKEWLETLPDGYRERALKGMDCGDATAESLSDAINEGIDWQTTVEGHAFWGAVHGYYNKWNELPSLNNLEKTWSPIERAKEGKLLLIKWGESNDKPRGIVIARKLGNDWIGQSGIPALENGMNAIGWMELPEF